MNLRLLNAKKITAFGKRQIINYFYPSNVKDKLDLSKGLRAFFVLKNLDFYNKSA